MQTSAPALNPTLLEIDCGHDAITECDGRSLVLCQVLQTISNATLICEQRLAVLACGVVGKRLVNLRGGSGGPRLRGE
jgi:hypothetical protein